MSQRPKARIHDKAKNNQEVDVYTSIDAVLDPLGLPLTLKLTSLLSLINTLFDTTVESDYKSVTYDELVSLRNTSQLKPRQIYRITDYSFLLVLATSPNIIKSANHPFDILVAATSKDTLSEDARAILSTRTDYFNSSDLSKWKLKYTLDNTLYNKEQKTYTDYSAIPGKYVWASRTLFEYTEGLTTEGHHILKVVRGGMPTYNKQRITHAAVSSSFENIAVGSKLTELYMEVDNLLVKITNYPLSVIVNKVAEITESSKGIITYMRDEYHNEAWYDFKNVLWKTEQFHWSSKAILYDPPRYKPNSTSAVSDNTRYLYTFTTGTADDIVDASLNLNGVCIHNNLAYLPSYETNPLTSAVILMGTVILYNNIGASSEVVLGYFGNGSVRDNTIVEGVRIFSGEYTYNLLVFRSYAVEFGDGCEDTSLRDCGQIFVLSKTVAHLSFDWCRYIVIDSSVVYCEHLKFTKGTSDIVVKSSYTWGEEDYATVRSIIFTRPVRDWTRTLEIVIDEVDLEFTTLYNTEGLIKFNNTMISEEGILTLRSLFFPTRKSIDIEESGLYAYYAQGFSKLFDSVPEDPDYPFHKVSYPFLLPTGYKLVYLGDHPENFIGMALCSEELAVDLPLTKKEYTTEGEYYCIVYDGDDEEMSECLYEQYPVFENFPKSTLQITDYGSASIDNEGADVCISATLTDLDGDLTSSTEMMVIGSHAITTATLGDASTTFKVAPNLVTITSLSLKFNEQEVATTNQIPNISGKADKATTLAGYGITDAYTREEADKRHNAYTITEDMVTVSTDDTKGTSPYSGSYGYTNIEINKASGIQWKEGAIYTFVVDTKLVVVSAYRNVRVRIGGESDGDVWHPLMGTSSILSGYSYLVKAYNTTFLYKTVYCTEGALHLLTDNNTTYTYLVNTVPGSANGSFIKMDANGYGARYSLIFPTTPISNENGIVLDERWSSLVASCSTGTTKAAVTPAGGKFYLDRMPLYVNSANIAKGATAVNALYQSYQGFDMRYVVNTNATYLSVRQKVFLYLHNYDVTTQTFESDATVGNIMSLDKISTRFPNTVEGDVYLLWLGWNTDTWYTCSPNLYSDRLYKYTPSTGQLTIVK